MNEHPILFSAPMVRAILEGRKTQTRRVIRFPEDPAGSRQGGGYSGWNPCRRPIPWGPQDQDADWPFGTQSFPIERMGPPVRCPYGKPGDRLWVRETWQHEDPSCDDHRCGNGDHIYYRATDPAPDTFASWRQSIFMPRWASRLTLEVQSVRVQRVQDITNADSRAEGCPGSAFGPGPNGDEGVLPSDQYRCLWDSLNAKRGFGWESNPWVWALTFRRVEEGRT